MKKPIPDLTVFKNRLRLRIDELGSNMAKVSKDAGLTLGYVSELLSGKANNPTGATKLAIAKAIDVDLAWLEGWSDVRRGYQSAASSDVDHPFVRAVGIPLMGTVEAGSFTEMLSRDELREDHEREQVIAPRSPYFPNARHYAFKVRGDSMNASQPIPYLEGSTVLCVDVRDLHMQLQDREVYVVRRSNDGGATNEYTLKRVLVFPDRYEMIPESTNLRHKPLIWMKDHDFEHSEKQVEAVALVYALIHGGKYA